MTKGYSDSIKINIKLIEDSIDIKGKKVLDEKKDLILNSLKMLIEHLEKTNGDVQRVKFVDVFCSLDYTHMMVSS